MYIYIQADLLMQRQVYLTKLKEQAKILAKRVFKCFRVNE